LNIISVISNSSALHKPSTKALTVEKVCFNVLKDYTTDFNATLQPAISEVVGWFLVPLHTVYLNLLVSAHLDRGDESIFEVGEHRGQILSQIIANNLDYENDG
jgi:hypothetical protein